MNDEKNFEIPGIFIFPMSKFRAGKFKMINAYLYIFKISYSGFPCS